jgi:hypothetical protein
MNEDHLNTGAKSQAQEKQTNEKSHKQNLQEAFSITRESRENH